MARWRGVIVRGALALVGLALLVSIVDHIGPEAIAELVLAALPWMPVALVLEGARIACDASATAAILGDRWRTIGAWRLFLGHVVGHGVMNVMPGGRSAAEAVKAALFYETIGAGDATAIGATNQANVLLASAIFSLPCAGAAFVVSADRRLAIAIVIHAAVLFGSGLGVRVIAASASIERFVQRRAPGWSDGLAQFTAAARSVPYLAMAPIGWMALGRAMQTLQYAVLAHAVGLAITPLVALTVQGTNLVAAAIGVLVPGQLGSSEAVFMLAADALGTTPARATSVALLAHASGVTWTATGLLVLLFWRAPRSSSA
jgi:hypothetical protein